MDNNMTSVQNSIFDTCNSIRDMLISKNRKYGNSALDPIRVFSQADPIEQIKVRIDDKLSRMKSSCKDEDEDVTLDLIGYLVLLRVAKQKKQNINGTVQSYDENGKPKERIDPIEFLSNFSPVIVNPRPIIEGPTLLDLELKANCLGPLSPEERAKIGSPGHVTGTAYPMTCEEWDVLQGLKANPNIPLKKELCMPETFEAIKNERNKNE